MTFQSTQPTNDIKSCCKKQYFYRKNAAHIVYLPGSLGHFMKIIFIKLVFS